MDVGAFVVVSTSDNLSILGRDVRLPPLRAGRVLACDKSKTSPAPVPLSFEELVPSVGASERSLYERTALINVELSLVIFKTCPSALLTPPSVTSFNAPMELLPISVGASAQLETPLPLVVRI